MATGPAGLRLADVADDLGITHQAILHHFGSREGLMSAVARSALEGLSRDLVAAFQTGREQSIDVREILDRAFDTLGARGHARLIAWLALSGLASNAPSENDLVLQRIAEEVHERSYEKHGPPLETSIFTILLAGLAVFADAIAGSQMRASAGLDDDPETIDRFRNWLADLLVAQFSGD